MLLYRTGKEQWSPPRGPEAYRRSKELREVFTHPIVKIWNNDLGWKVVEVMDTHKVRFTTIDVVRFKKVDVDEAFEDEEDAEFDEDIEGEEEETVKKPDRNIGPITVWIGVFPESTSPTAAHNAAQDVKELLKVYDIADVDVDFRESLYIREVGPRLLEHVRSLDPLVDDLSSLTAPLTPTLGLGISTKTRSNTLGTMALYLAEGGGSETLLGLSCRHVLFGGREGNLEYISHPNAPRRDVILLGRRAFTNLVDSIKLRLGHLGIEMKLWSEAIEGFEERENGSDAVDEEAKADRFKAQELLNGKIKGVEALGVLLNQVTKGWKNINNRILGHIVRSPAITLGAGEHHFTEDWAIFDIDRAKLGYGFKGNQMDLGTKLTPSEFTLKCFPHGDANWSFKYPFDRLLPLRGTLINDLMRSPDMWDSNGEPCLLVIKNGNINATGTTIGRANGAFSIVRDYFNDMSISQTSMEWAIINYDSKSDVFSAPGDSGSAIADIRGRLGGMLTGSCGTTRASDITYATPFWWLLERIKANGFPNAHLNVVA